MVRWYLTTLKVANILVFFWILAIFNTIFDQSLIDFAAVINVITSLKNIISYLIFGLLYLVAIGLSMMIIFLFLWHSYFDPSFMRNFLDNLFKGLLNSWFAFPEGPIESLGQIPSRLLNQIELITDDIYNVSFQILFLLLIINFIRSTLQTNPKYNFWVVGCLVGMIIIPLFFEGLRNAFNLFNISIEYLDDLPNPLFSSILERPVNDFISFILSSIFQLALALYIYLDISFQINYINLISMPSLERSERLESQLDVLKKEALEITTNIEQIKEESKKKKEELGIEKEAKISKFLGKKEQKFSYIKEMILKKKLEEEEKKLISAAHDTRRLGSYIERLFVEDSEARDTLTATSSAPRPSKLIVSTLTSFFIRVIALIFIGFIILHTSWIIISVLNLPEAISGSVAMFSPEIILVIMLPIILLFPLSAQIISYVKKRALTSQLREESEIKEIIATVGDYLVSTEQEKSEIVEEEGEVSIT